MYGQEGGDEELGGVEGEAITRIYYARTKAIFQQKGQKKGRNKKKEKREREGKTKERKERRKEEGRSLLWRVGFGSPTSG